MRAGPPPNPARRVRARSVARVGWCTVAVTVAAACGSAGDAGAGGPATDAPGSAPSTAGAPIEPFTVGFAGDTALVSGLAEADPFGEVVDLLQGPDVMLVNLETAVAPDDVGTPYPKDFTFRSPPVTVDLLVEAGVDGVSLANNHSLDYGRDAVASTLDLLDAGGVARTGGGLDPDEAYTAATFAVGGRTLAVVGFSHVPCDWSAADPDARPEVAWTCPPHEERAVEAVEAAAAAADVVVVMAHWGTERERCPDPYQHRLARRWIDAGADLVVGGHHHVLQGVERVGGAHVVHGMGNFAFPTARGEGADSAVFVATFAPDGTSTLAVHPVRITAGRPAPVGGAAATAIRDTVTRYSWGLAVAEDGEVVADPDATGSCPAPGGAGS